MCSNNAIGIIAEYNPLHNGHAYLLQQARAGDKAKPVIAVMSGDFVQRGEPALLDKWTRARMAVACGIDLVLELPVSFCVRSAEYFALGGVKVLTATGLVDTLAFGVENLPDYDADALAAYLNSPRATERFKSFMRQNHNYGAAWENVASEWNKSAGNCLKGPNNILAMSYRRAILQCQTPIKPLPILRNGNDYHDKKLHKPYASATAIREALYNRLPWNDLEGCLPLQACTVLKEHELYNEPVQPLKMLVAYELLHCKVEQLYERTISDYGLCFRILKQRSFLHDGWENYLAAVTNKRYPKASLKRIFLQLLLQESRTFWQETLEPKYLRVLAFNERGQFLLRNMKNKATLPILTKTGSLRRKDHDANFNRQLALDTRASDLFELLYYHFGKYGTDFTTSPSRLGK